MTTSMHDFVRLHAASSVDRRIPDLVHEAAFGAGLSIVGIPLLPLVIDLKF